MNRQAVTRCLAAHDGDALTFSVLSRALITNTKHRHRSTEARNELRALLDEMQADGLLRLRPTGQGRGGRGLLIEVVQPTHETRKP